jgi:hypothetical protein
MTDEELAAACVDNLMHAIAVDPEQIKLPKSHHFSKAASRAGLASHRIVSMTASWYQPGVPSWET